MDQRSVARGQPVATTTSTSAWTRRGVRLVVAALAIAVILGLALTAAWATAPRLGDPDALVRRRVASLGGRDVPLADVAPILLQAVVAGEDQRFYRHHGIDLFGLMRAAGYDVGHVSLAEGGSTITEQLAKDLYLGGDDRSPLRKVQAAILALGARGAAVETADPRRLPQHRVLRVGGDGHRGGEPPLLRHGALGPRSGSGEPAGRTDPVPEHGGPLRRPGRGARSSGRCAARDGPAGDVTSAQARAAMDTPLPLVSGGSIPGRPDVAVEPAPAVSPWLLALGAALIVAAVVSLVRRPAAAMRLAGWLVVAAGVLLALRAVRGD